MILMIRVYVIKNTIKGDGFLPVKIRQPPEKPPIELTSFTPNILGFGRFFRPIIGLKTN